MDHNLIGYFADSDAVARAQQALRQAGFADDDITLQTDDNAGAPSVYAAPTAATSAIVGDGGRSRASDGEPEGGIGGMLKSLVGMERDKANVNYDGEAVGRGAYLLVVSARDDVRRQQADAILRECGASDIGERNLP